MVVKQAIPGQYFDVDQPLNSDEASVFVKAGYLGVFRYAPRNQYLGHGDLTAGELAILLSAGLNVGIVQHVSPDGWTPTEALGTNYGSYAAQYAKEIGYLIGANIFCDLEMVSSSSLSSDIISFCNAWWEAVNSAGYIPGLYVGYNSGLTPGQLYSDLKFQHYWAAYNYTDGVAKRGVQIQQHTAKVLNGISFDPNTVSPDNEGGLPMFLSNS